MDQHRGIDLEHHKIAGTVQPAVDAEIFKADALLDGAQRLVMPGIENPGGILQKRLFFRSHPWLIDHVRADVMHLPVVSDREVIRQNLIIDENEAILPEMTIGGAIVDILDQIVIDIGALRQKGRKLSRVFDLFEIIAAMRPDRPGQNG